MAQARKFNVVVIDTNGDTLAGPANISSIRLIGGAASSSGSIACASVTIYQSATVGAGAVDAGYDLDIRVGGSETLTFTLAGSGTKMYVYMDE